MTCRRWVQVPLNALLMLIEYRTMIPCSIPTIVFFMECCCWIPFVNDGNDMKHLFEHYGWLLMLTSCENLPTLILFTSLLPLIAFYSEIVVNRSSARTSQVLMVSKLVPVAAGCYFLLTRKKLDISNVMPIIYLCIQFLMYNEYSRKMTIGMKLFFMTWLVLGVISSHEELDDFILHMSFPLISSMVICGVFFFLTYAIEFERLGQCCRRCKKRMRQPVKVTTTTTLAKTNTNNREMTNHHEPMPISIRGSLEPIPENAIIKEEDAQDEEGDYRVELHFETSPPPVEESSKSIPVERIRSNVLGYRNVSLGLCVSLNAILFEYRVSLDVALMMIILLVVQMHTAKISVINVKCNSLFSRFTSLVSVFLLISIYLGLFYAALLKPTQTKEIHIPIVRNDTTMFAHAMTEESFFSSSWAFYGKMEEHEAMDGSVFHTLQSQMLSFLSCVPIKSKPYIKEVDLLLCIYRHDYGSETWTDLYFSDSETFARVGEMGFKFHKSTDARLISVNDQVFMVDRTNDELSLIEVLFFNKSVQIGRSMKLYVSGASLSTPFVIEGILYVIDFDSHSLMDMGSLYHAMYNGLAKIVRKIPLLMDDRRSLKLPIKEGTDLIYRPDPNRLCVYASSVALNWLKDDCCLTNGNIKRTMIRPVEWCLQLISPHDTTNITTALLTPSEEKEEDKEEKKEKDFRRQLGHVLKQANEEAITKALAFTIENVHYRWDHWIVEPISSWIYNGRQFITASTSQKPRTQECYYRACKVSSVIYTKS